MPPEGYDTVTLPEELVQEIESLELGSRRATIRHLLTVYQNERRPEDGKRWGQGTPISAVYEDIGSQLDRIEEAVEEGRDPDPVTLEATEYSHIADEVEGRLR